MVVGAALLVLPGPGILVVLAGVSLLATEFDWASRLQARVRAFVDERRPRRSADSGDLARRTRPTGDRSAETCDRAA